MKDAFKIKKGLNVQPTDPAEVVNPEAGDIIVDSTDDNRMKVYDPTAGEFSAVGTGGSSGNILADIEKLTPTVTNVVTTIDTTVFLPIDDNNKSVKATFSGSDGTIRYEAPASADLDGVQGVVKVWIKTDVEGLSLVATKDGVAQNNGVTVNSTNKWRQYEIPVVLGDADYGFEIQASGAVSGDVYIDEAFVKVEQVTQNLGQAHFVGSAQLSTNCIYSRNSTSYGIMTDADICSFTSTKGNVSQLSNPLIGGINISNIRTDGYYRVFYQGLMYNTGNANVCYFSLSKSTSGDATFGETYVTSTNRSEHNTFADIRFNDGESGDIYILNKSNVATQCSVYGSGGNDGYWSVYFYPDSSSTIVTQDTELTAKTANEFSARINGVSTCSVFTENYNWIDSCTRNATGQYTIDITSLGLSSNPVITCLSRRTGGVDKYCSLENLSTNSFSVNIRRGDNDALNDGYFHIKLSKQGADVNKSATIIGKFENINSSDLIQMKYDKITVQVIPNGSVETILFDNSIYDNSNGAYNPATGIFTAPRDGTYKICASWMYEAAVWGIGSPMWHYVGDQIPKRFEVTTTNSDFYSMFGCDTVKLSQGETQPIARAEQGSGSNKQNIASSGYNYFTLEEQATYEAIVKNLSNQKTKCQTKTLSAQINATGEMPDLRFNNIDTSKRYRVNANIRFADATLTVNEKYGVFSVYDGDIALNKGLAFAYTRSLNISRHGQTLTINKIIKPTENSIRIRVNVLTNMVIPNGDESTWVELCELPDTYVETTKF